MADAIAAFCGDKNFEDYRRDEMLKAAVERKFAVIGEALSRLANVDPATAARIPEHRKIIAFRNIIIHGYANVDDKIVWGVVEANLSALRSAVAKLLAEG
ncbi:MAG: HepT-like ribonuclease domain-containing protein [Burkholderiales bacterium]